MKNYAGTPFQFQIGDKTFVLQEVGFSDVEKVSSFGEGLAKDPEKAVAAIHDLIQSKSDKRTADAVLSIPPRKILELIKDWTGISAGESETSGDE